MINLLTGVQSSKKNYYAELKATVDELQKKNDQLEIINEVMSSFTVDFSVANMLKKTLHKLQAVYPIDRLSAALVEGQKLVLSYVYPESEVFFEKNTILQEGESLYYDVFSTGKDVIYFNNNPSSFFEKQSFEALGIVSAHLIPLTRSGKTIGVLSLGSRSSFLAERDDLSFFYHLASQIAVCMENARLYGEVIAGKHRWEETFRAVSDTIIVISEDGTVRTKNEAAVRDWDIRIGDNIKPLLEAASISPSDPFQLTIETKMPHSAQLHYEDRIYDCTCYPLINNDSIDGVILYSKDITKKRQLEVQLLHSTQLAAIGEMAAGVAHELNNPLTSIIGNAQLLLRSNINDEHLSLLDDIDHCGKRCRAIIRSLLAFSRQEEGMFTRCSINIAVSEALTLTRRQLENHHIHIHTLFNETLPPILGNVQQLSQIAVNLLMNAKDALKATTGEKVISIRTFVEEPFVILEIEDNGIPIPPAVLKDIFHPFFTTKDAENGTGLGLSVSFGLAQAHRGELFVRQEERTTFCLKLPILYEGM